MPKNLPPTGPGVPGRPPVQKGINWKWLGGVIAVFVLMGVVASFGTDDERSTSRSSSSSSSSSPRSAAAAPRTTSAAEASAAAERSRAAAEAAAAQEAARLDRGAYSPIDAREFALLAKTPDRYIGRKFVIYGVVTQFDAATGSDTFRANTASQPQDYQFDYDVNSVVEGYDSVVAANVVEDDYVTMFVSVDGSFSYDTQIGGSTTVPKFTANMIDVTGSVG